MRKHATAKSPLRLGSRTGRAGAHARSQIIST
jgi:hypothetical protein